MSLLMSMLPLYVFGNLHCMGMCGPLALMLGKHRFRYFYFLGRLISFTLAGTIAGALGSVIHVVLNHYYIPAVTSFLFGGFIIIVGIYSFFGWQYPGYHWLAKRLSPANNALSLLMLRDRLWPTFLFGFLTIALPCGQTVVVFSACALSGDAWIGMLNGFVFAAITSPSLWLAMHMHTFLHKLKRYYNSIMGGCAVIVGLLACFRGLAEVQAIPHWVVNPEAPTHYHIVVY